MSRLYDVAGRRLFVAAVFLIVTFFFVGMEEAEAKYKLNLATYDPAQSANTRYQLQWAERVKEATQGEVEIAVYPGGTLCSATDTLDAVKTGICDIGWIFTSFYPNQFPFVDVVTLPMMGIATAQQATNVLWDLYETEPAIQNDLKDFQMLMLFTNNSNLIGTSTKPVKTVEDIKGMKLRTPTGAATSVVQAWGGNPIAMGPGDMYQAMQKGVIEGYVFEFAGIGNYALPEVTKYYTELNLYVGPFMLLMNRDVWNELPEETRNQILSVSGRETSLGAAKCFEEDGNATRENIVRKGGTLIEVTPEAYAGFRSAVDDYNARWVTKHKIQGVDSKAFFNKTVELIKKYR